MQVRLSTCNSILIGRNEYELDASLHRFPGAYLFSELLLVLKYPAQVLLFEIKIFKRVFFNPLSQKFLTIFPKVDNAFN